MEKNRIQDEELMVLTAQGDNEAFDILIRRHQSLVYNLACRLIGNKTVAEDIAQDSFLRVYQSAGKFTPKAKFTTWLYRIVYNLCIDHIRKPKHQAISDDSLNNFSTDTDVGGELETQEISEKIRLAVSQLPDRQKEAVIMHRFGHLSHSQIAEIIGTTNAAVESLLVRAYSELRVKLKDLKDTI